MAKIYHPDILSKRGGGQADEKFKDFNLAYERLLKWVEERDSQMQDRLKSGQAGVKVNEDGSVTYTLGKLQLEGKRSHMDKQ